MRDNSETKRRTFTSHPQRTEKGIKTTTRKKLSDSRYLDNINTK
jgi:hypothetical protein